MGLKKKITLFITLLISTTVIVISGIAIYSIYHKGQEDIARFRTEEMTKAKGGLKDIVDLAYGIVETGYGKNTADNMQPTLDLLAQIRFDNREGYFWITDTKLPYPTMVMHAAKPGNNGKEMSAPKYNVVKHKEGKNLYQERVENVLQNNDAFVEYIMVKPGQEKIFEKLSYSRLFRPLNWVISSGIYTDVIEERVGDQATATADQIKRTALLFLIVSLIMIAIGVFLSIRFSDGFVSIIMTVRDRLQDLSQGKITQHIKSVRDDELGDMTSSLNDLMKGINHYSNFAKEIGNDQLDSEFEPLSGDDILGNELLKMRNNLSKNRKESGIRNWATEGVAKFADILRSDNDIKSLSTKIIINYVKYLKANQGSLYLLMEEEGQSPYLELMATYAYDRQKYLEKRISVDFGLNGQCVKERATIHLQELPQDYINITSGLGLALPDSLLIVPLKFNENIYGVIEIASFKKFDDYEIEFAEKLCEDIASTISSVRTNERTRMLLDESEQMAESMRSQEEELRQNQEELQATQEEMKRRQDELEEENTRLKIELEK
jgi:methyl-accepting chemotaxis protein